MLMKNWKVNINFYHNGQLAIECLYINGEKKLSIKNIIKMEA